MNWFYNLSIKIKLLTLVGVMLFLITLVGLQGLKATSDINEKAEQMYEEELKGLSYIKESYINLLYQGRALRNYLLAQTDPNIDQTAYRESINQYQSKIEDYLKRADQRFDSEESNVLFKQVYDTLQKNYEFNQELIRKAQEERASGQVLQQERETVSLALVDSSEMVETLDNAMDQLTRIKEQNADDSADLAQALYNQSFVVILSLLAFALVFGLALGILISGRISRNVSRIATGMKKLSEDQDFGYRVPRTDEDETGQMAKAINGLLGSLESSIDEANATISALSVGDFSKRMSGNYAGDLHAMKQGINLSADNISKVMEELGEVLQAIRDGQFDVQIESTAQGEYQRMLKNAQSAMSEMNAVIGNIGDVMDKVALGEFTQRVEVDASGEMNDLKQAINKTVTTLDDVIDDISGVMRAQGKGDLTLKIKAECSGQLNEIKESINSTAENLSRIIASAITSASVVENAADEVSRGSLDLSQRVQEQAAALEETSATMDEMNAAVQNNTQNAQQANKLAQDVQDKADNGTKVMQQTIEAMMTIQASSQKIAEIVTLIDGIAFQTNLLALNAAVEAARAGDHGRGFAVVAGEVRALAQKSAEAAKDIKSLIDESVGRIDHGTQLATESGEVLNNINQAVVQVTDMISQIASASSQQAEGIQQVHKAISDIDQVTQQNAALVEETSAAAESMNEQAAELKDNMAFFTTQQHQKLIAKPAANLKVEEQSPKKVLPQSPQVQAESAKTPVKESAEQEWSEF